LMTNRKWNQAIAQNYNSDIYEKYPWPENFICRSQM